MLIELFFALQYYSALALLFVGAFFILTSAVGLLRFRDVYTRLHAASKGSTFGFCFMVLGAAMLLGQPDHIAKAILAVLFQFLTAPISAHMIARIALRKGLRPVANPEGEPLIVVDHPSGDEPPVVDNRAGAN